MLTPKQEAFAAAYMETNVAVQAYRKAYDTAKMKPRSVEKCASELLGNPRVAQRIAELRGQVAREAVLNRAWVISRLMKNARIAMGEERITIAVKAKDKDEVSEVEVTDRDAAAANRALELLGKADEVRLFTEQPPNANQEALVEKPRDTGRDHLLRLAQRYANGLKVIEGGAAHPVGDGPRRLSARD
jgi:hypothetical protein